MSTAATVLTAMVALEHFWFLALEMFFWETPLGLKTFRMSRDKAKTTAPLAKNQGLYNGFLAAALVAALAHPDPAIARAFQLYGLGCVVVAGCYGARTVSRSIAWVQALPAAVALALALSA